MATTLAGVGRKKTQRRIPPRATGWALQWVSGVAEATGTLIEAPTDGSAPLLSSEAEARAEMWGGELRAGRYELFGWDGRRSAASGD